MASRIDKEETAVDAGILNVAVTHSSELFAKVCAVLILYVFDNRVPANVQEKRPIREFIMKKNLADIPIFIIDLVAIARSVDDVKS